MILWFITGGKLHLWSNNEDSFMVGGLNNMRNCIKHSTRKVKDQWPRRASKEGGEHKGDCVTELGDGIPPTINYYHLLHPKLNFLGLCPIKADHCMTVTTMVATYGHWSPFETITDKLEKSGGTGYFSWNCLDMSICLKQKNRTSLKNCSAISHPSFSQITAIQGRWLLKHFPRQREEEAGSVTSSKYMTKKIFSRFWGARDFSQRLQAWTWTCMTLAELLNF